MKVIIPPNALFCDGGVISKNPSTIGGTWAARLVIEDKPVRHDSGIVFPLDIYGEPVSNNLTEMLALLILALLLIILIFTTPAIGAPGSGIARVVAADCRESVMIWQNAPAVGLQGSTAAIIFETDTGAPFIVYYDYDTTLRNGNAVYRPDWWYGMGLHGRTITVISGTIYSAAGGVPGYVAADDVFTITCKRVYLPVLGR